MGSGMAFTCGGAARRAPHGGGRGAGVALRARLAGGLFVAATLLAQACYAQDAGGFGPGDGIDGRGAAQEPDRGTDLAQTQGASDPEAAGDAADDDAATSDPAVSDARAEADIGLIEAPDMPAGSASEDADLLSEGGDFFDSADAPAFAERRSQPARARMLGPIEHPPVVVELFTSQGCSSCPPADDMLADLADRDNILALSWHVDYWDYLGWADEFARPEFTRRQQAYAHAWGERAIYTPQVVVGGSDTLIALRPAELMMMVDAQMARPAPVLVTSREKDGAYQIDLTPRVQNRARVALLLVRYAPKREVMIRAGENRGVDVTYRNVVLGVERIGEWDGKAPLRMTVRADMMGKKGAGDYPADTRHVILAQQMGRGRDRSAATGPILAAIRLD